MDILAKDSLIELYSFLEIHELFQLSLTSKKNNGYVNSYFKYFFDNYIKNYPKKCNLCTEHTLRKYTKPNKKLHSLKRWKFRLFRDYNICVACAQNYPDWDNVKNKLYQNDYDNIFIQYYFEDDSLHEQNESPQILTNFQKYIVINMNICVPMRKLFIGYVTNHKFRLLLNKFKNSKVSYFNFIESEKKIYEIQKKNKEKKERKFLFYGKGRYFREKRMETALEEINNGKPVYIRSESKKIRVDEFLQYAATRDVLLKKDFVINSPYHYHRYDWNAYKFTK